MNTHAKVEISYKTIAFAVLFPVFIYFLWIVRELLFSLLIAFILMSALRPGVISLEKRKIPHGVAVFTVYLSFLLVFLFLISLMIPPIIRETRILARNLPDIIEKLTPQLDSLIQGRSLEQYLPNVTNQLLRIIGGIFSNTLFLVSTLFFGFYFLLEENVVKKLLSRYLSEERAHRISEIIAKAEIRMSSWFWGELALMTVVGVFSYIGLTLIGVNYVLPLAVLAGLLEVVPNFGPVLSAIPAVIIGFFQSYFTGFSVIALYFIVQQLENNLIVPIIMKRAVGLNPIITLMALIIGGKIGGVLGVLISIPAFLFIETVVFELMKNKKLAENLR